MSIEASPKRYEEYAYVLDSTVRGRSSVIRGREGPIVQAIGEDRFTLLEFLALNNAKFEIGERISIGQEGRTKIKSVLGRLSYDDLSNDSKEDLMSVVESMILLNESRYIIYYNELQPLTPRLHALELIPGIGKTIMKQIVEERTKNLFSTFEDLQNRVKIRDPIKLLAKGIIKEISGATRICLFMRR